MIDSRSRRFLFGAFPRTRTRFFTFVVASRVSLIVSVTTAVRRRRAR